MTAVRVGDRVRVDQPGLLVPAPEPFRSGVVVASAWSDHVGDVLVTVRHSDGSGFMDLAHPVGWVTPVR